MKITLLTLPLLAFALIGCNGDKTTDVTSPPKDAAADGTTPPVTPTPDAPDPSKLSAALKNEAYEYYGLGSDKPIDMEVLRSDSDSVITGSQANVLKSIDGESAIYAIERTGGLAILGTQTVRLGPNGIYLDEVMDKKIEGDEIELPADLTPGKTWTTHLKFESGGQSMDVTSTSTIKGVEKFKTKVGDREGMLVVSTGSGKWNGKDVRIDGKSWYVKGIGGVKNTLTTTYKNPKDGKPQTLTVQETK